MKSPKVGIFWLVKGSLIFDATPVAEADADGDSKNHPRGHFDRWKQMQNAGTVPADIEYEEYPRGRVIFESKTGKFLVLADRCILQRRGLVERIMKRFELPVNKTKCATDSHYRCYKCLGYKT